MTATVKPNRHHLFMLKSNKIRHRRDIKVRIKHTIVLSVFSVLFQKNIYLARNVTSFLTVETKVEKPTLIISLEPMSFRQMGFVFVG